MAGFKEQYETVFGPQAPYDPIKLKKRTAIDAEGMLAGAPSATPDATPDSDLFLPEIPIGTTPDGGSGVLENVGRQIGAGTVQVGEMGLDAAGWLARKTPITDGIVADAVYSMRDGLTGVREDILAGIDEEGRKKAAAEFLTLDPNRTIWQGNPLEFAEAVLYKAANALPATVATLAPPIAFARAGMTAKAILSMGATEGVLSLGGIAGGIRDEINALDTETLMNESPRFQQLLDESGGDADYAREQLITEAQGYSPLIGGAAVAAISSVAGRYFTPIFEKTGGAALGSRAGRGFAAEFPQEASQGGTEQMVQNYAARIYDMDRQLSEGVAEASVQEGVIGGAMGAGAGAAFGQRPQRPTPPRPAIDLDARPEITEQMDFGGDLAPGGPDPELLPDELDQPSAEPPGDLQAQMRDLIEGGRDAVYISPDQDPRTYSVPDTLIEMEDVDGRGGSLIVRDEQTALDARARISQGESRQAVIGSLVGAGEGKPTNPASRVVQLLDEEGNVVRESMVATPTEAEALGTKWSKEKENKNRRVTIMSPREALERRQALGQEATVPIQEDLFDNTAARGTEGVAVPPAPDQSQGELPLRDTRPRRERVQQPVTPTGVPTQLPEEGAGTPQSPLPQQGQEDLFDQGEVDRRQFGMDFREPVTETETTRSQREVPTPDLAVQVVSEEGEVLEEHRYGTPEFAEEAADDLAAQYPEFTIRVVPATRTETQVKTRAKVTPRGPIEPEYQGDVLEEVRDDIRDAIPFEERAEPIAEVEGARSVGQAGDKLVSRAASEFDTEEKARIGGFYNPDRLTFNNPEYGEAYREAWNTALDAELTIEMSKNKREVERAKKRRQKALQEMGEVRQIDKPKLGKGKSETFYKAARAVDPTKRFEKPERESPTGGPPKEYGTATQQRQTEEDYLGEFDITTRDEADNLPNYMVRHKTPKGQWVEETYESNDEAMKRVAEIKEKYPKRKVVKRMLTSRELDAAFEQAVLFREGREADTRVEDPESVKVERDTEKPRELTGNLEFKEDEAPAEETAGEDVSYEARINRERYRTPGQKLKFIRREAETLRRRETGQRSVKSTPVRRSATESRVKQRPGESEADFQKRVKKAEEKKKFDTAPLTQENYPLDESVESRVKREAEAKKARSEVGKAATKASAVLRRFKGKNFEVKGEFGLRNAFGDKFADDFLYARKYLEELIQFARSIQASKSKSNQTIALAKGVTKMLESVTDPKLDVEIFARDWGAVARANEFDDLANLKFTSLASMRDPKKRAKATRASYNKAKGIREMREINEQLRNDDLYRNMIEPVIQKMTAYFERASSGQPATPYIPNEVELAEIRYAMMTYRHNLKPTRAPEKGAAVNKASGQESFVFPDVDIEYNPLMNRTEMFTALQKRMMDVGFEFDGWGNVVGFQATDRYLLPRYNERFKGERADSETDRRARVESYGQHVKAADLAPEITPSMEHVVRPTREQEQTVEEAMAALDKNKGRLEKKKPVQPSTDKKPNVLTVDAVNGLINRFKKETASSKTTISGIKRQEARFIRGLKKLGVWRQTSPDMGTITIPGRPTKNYRLVAPRVGRGKPLSKPQAKEIIQRIATMPIPKEMMAEVRKARKDREMAAGLERFLDDNAIELFREAAGPVRYDTEYSNVAESLGDSLIDGIVSGTDAVNMVLQLTPQNSFYRNLAVKLSEKDLSDVKVVYGDETDFPSGDYGKYTRGSNTVFLNREVLQMGQGVMDEVAGARVVHSLMHELVHAQTHKAIDENPRLKQYFETLQRRAREAWQDNVGGALPYGLKILVKTQNQAHEFVAEAFSNHSFQEFLKDTPIESPNTGTWSLWRALVNAIRYTLNLPENPPNNLFDAIMLTEDILFDDAGFGGGVEGDLFLSGDAVLDNVASHTNDLFAKSSEWLSRAKNQARNLLTFDQLYDMYGKYFTNGAFERYMDAFKRRNSAISANMKVPEKLSTRWTELEATEADAALELSRIGTEATIRKMTPSKQLTAKEREETSPRRLKYYDALRARYLALSPKAQKLYDDLREYYKTSHEEEANLLLDASLRGILTKGPNASMTTEEFRQKLPREVIAKLSKREDLVEALKDHIPEENLKGVVKQVQRLAHLRTISVGDYFPLMRYGDYTVYKKVDHPDVVFDDYGKAMARRKELLDENPSLQAGVYTEGEKHILRTSDVEFWMFESKTEAQKKADEIGSHVEARRGRKKTASAISSNAELTSILTTLKGNPAAQAAIKEHYLRSLADQSFRKTELKRKNTVGVNYDLQHRNLANYLKQSAYYRAQLEHGWRMGEALQEMEDFVSGRPDGGGISTEQLGRVVENVKYRDGLTNEADELNKLVRSGVNLTQFMMLTSPSYWLINATQPWLVTAPIMGGKHGMGSSYSALKHAFQLVKTPLTKEAWESKFGLSALTDPVQTEKAFNVVDQLLFELKKSTDPRKDDYIELIDELRDINIIDINVLTELRQIADGVEGKLGTKVLDASRILAHITEVNNRVVTAIAAYNLEMNKTGDKKAAKKYAADMISQTQFNYSSENKPPLFQSGGPLKWAAPLMFQFMQWPQHMYALLIRNVHASVKGESKEVRREALKSLTGLLTTHAAVGGLTGMALQPIKWAFGMLMFAFGDDDEPYTFANAINGRTFDNFVQEVSTDLFGSTMGRAVGSGLPTLLGTDLSARMSMGTLYFVDLRGDTAESILGSLAASFGGATLNQALNWGNALGKVADGDVYRGVEQAMPKIFRDVMRAGRYYNEGLVNNAGDTVIPAEDLSFAEAFLQGIGFSPDEVSRFYQGQAAIKGAQGYARDRRESIIRQFVEDGSSSDILREVREFNRAYPSLRITRSTLIRGARAQIEREGRYGRYGANIDEKEARDFKRYGDPFR